MEAHSEARQLLLQALVQLNVHPGPFGIDGAVLVLGVSTRAASALLDGLARAGHVCYGRAPGTHVVPPGASLRLWRLVMAAAERAAAGGAAPTTTAAEGRLESAVLQGVQAGGWPACAACSRARSVDSGQGTRSSGEQRTVLCMAQLGRPDSALPPR